MSKRLGPPATPTLRFDMSRPLGDVSNEVVQGQLSTCIHPALEQRELQQIHPGSYNAPSPQLEILSNRYYPERLSDKIARLLVLEDVRAAIEERTKDSTVSSPLRIGSVSGWAGRDGRGNVRFGYSTLDTDCQREHAAVREILGGFGLQMYDNTQPEIIMVLGQLKGCDKLRTVQAIMDKHKPEELFVDPGIFSISKMFRIAPA